MEENDDEEKCLICEKTFKLKSILTHIARAKGHKKYPQQHLQALREKSHASSRNKHNAKRRQNYEQDGTSAKKRKYYVENQQEIIAKYRQKRQESKRDMERVFDPTNKMFGRFFQEIKHGPIFPCISCMRCLPLRSMKSFQEKFHNFLSENNLQDNVDMKESLKINGKHYICSTCHLSLSKQKLPSLCFKNGLKLSPIPKCLQISSLGNQLIAKYITFIKIRRLPKTRMASNYDRVSYETFQ